MDLEATAAEIATLAHAGQTRRDGRTPYIEHPCAVAGRVGSDPLVRSTAWLHDVLEDSDWTAARLLDRGIPQTVVDAVDLLTKDPKQGLAYEEYLVRLRQNPIALEVKIADMLSNLADSPTQKQIIKYARGLLILHAFEP